MTVYAVHMFRYGDEERHSYIHCICATEAIAEVMGTAHKEERAGKYAPKIIAMEVLETAVSRCADCNVVYHGLGWYCPKCSWDKFVEAELPALFQSVTDTPMCNLTPEEILKDLSYVVDLTGSETPSEIEHLHQSLYHSTDGDPSEFQFDEKSYDQSPTVKELAINARDERQAWQRCAICPPNRGENSSRKPKRGAQKKLKPNKKQGAEMKRIFYNEAELQSGYVDKTKKAGKRK